MYKRQDNIHIGTNGSTFDLIHHEETYTITTNLVAMYNIYNLLGAIAAMCESGVALKEIVPYLSELTQMCIRDRIYALLFVVQTAHWWAGKKILI